MASEASSPHHIIVVGGGAGGLELATRLGDKLGRRKLADVTLIDRSRSHLWKPLLHEIAAGTMDLGVHEIDFLAQAHWHHFRYRIGEMIGLDRARREVWLAPHVDDEGQEVTPRRSFRYDTLIIAVGSESNDFGTPGVREHAISLDTATQAKRFHGRLVNAYIRGHAQPQPLRSEQLQVAIIGAGATGTELAAELHYTTRQLVAYGLDRIDPEKDIQINLIEAADRILPALPERLSDAAVKLLQNLGVRVHTSSKVAEVSATGVKLANGTFIPAELVVWAAGVKAPDILANLDGLESTRVNQLIVLPTLQTTRDENIFVMGGLCRLRVGKPSWPLCPTPRAGSAPAGHASRQANQATAGRHTAAAVALSGLRLARFARRVLDGRQPDGRTHRGQPMDRGPVRAADVPIALQDA